MSPGKLSDILSDSMKVMHVTAWRNGSASDSRSEGCVFKSRRGHFFSYNPLGVFQEHI